MRRFILILSTVLIPLPSVAAQAEWNFRVYLNDEAIGYHRFVIQRDAQVRRVASEARYDVRFLFLTAYRYRHTSLETWRGDCLASIESRTDDNGEAQFIDGERDNRLLRISTHAGDARLNGCIRTFAYWDPKLLNAKRLLNTQTGEYMEVQIRFIGLEEIAVAGRELASKRYRLLTDGLSIDLWYTQEDHEWLRLESTTQSGHRISYRLQARGEPI